MASAKPRVKSTVNRQVKAALGAVRDFVAGRVGEAKFADSEDKTLRKAIAAELLAAMSGGPAEPSSRKASTPLERRTDKAVPGEVSDSSLKKDSTTAGDKLSGSNGDAVVLPDSTESVARREQERARQLFLDHGYLDEAVQDLRGATSAAERAAAARSLGIVGSGLGNVHLIAALFDESDEVREAAQEALARLGGPALASEAQGAVSDGQTAEPKAKSPDEPATSRPATAEDELSEFKASTTSEQLVASTTTPLTTPSTAAGKLEKSVPTQTSPFPKPVQSQSSGTASTQKTAFDDSAAVREEEQILLEEDAVLKVVAELERRLLESAIVRTGLEKEARLRSERESKLRAEGATRRLEAEETRRRFEEEAETRRSQEDDAVKAEQEARQRNEAEAHRLAEEEGRLRAEAIGLRLAAEELSRQRVAIETTRREAREAASHAAATRAREEADALHKSELAQLRAEEEALRTTFEQTALQRSEVEISRKLEEAELVRLAEERAQLAAAELARKAEAERMLNEAEERNRTEQEQLQIRLDALRRVAEEVTIRRAAVDAAREKADIEAERLVEAQARMRVGEEARVKAEAERVNLEAEINQRLDTEQRLLEETRRRAESEKQRLDQQLRRRTEEAERSRAELEATRKEAEIDAAQRAAQEQQIATQIESLRIADAEARKRIVEAEARQRTSEEAHSVAAEQVQRVEAQAHARAVEEEQILTKLEAARREAAVEAQGRAEQEKRIREEIEQFRKLEEAERPLLEAAILRRKEAEARLQQERERLANEESARRAAEELLGTFAAESGRPGSLEDDSEQLKPASLHTSAIAEVLAATRGEAGPNGSASSGSEATLEQDLLVDGSVFASVPPTIVTYLNSVDPYKRAAAVGELARSGGSDAFSLITKCFDDHSPHVRNAAARALRQLQPGRGVDLFNRALEEASDQRKLNIGSAIANSGVATESVDHLDGANREDTYNALCMLLIMAKTGEVQPLVKAIEEHEDEEVCRAATKILTLSGQPGMADAALKLRAGKRKSKAKERKSKS